MHTHPRTPFRTHLLRASFLALAGSALLGGAWYHIRQAELVEQAVTASPVAITPVQKPAAVVYKPSAYRPVLHEADVEAYRAVFRAQQQADWAAADALLATVSNAVLRADVLAQRYLHKQYTTRFEEARDWLAQNPDHPQSTAIQALARKLRKNASDTIPAVRARKSLSGAGDDTGLGVRIDRMGTIDANAWTGRADAKKQWDHIEALIDNEALDRAEGMFASAMQTKLFRDNEADTLRWELATHYYFAGETGKALKVARSATPQAMPELRWLHGLSAWKARSYKEAASAFSDVADNATVHKWRSAAGAYWAYRSYSALGDDARAKTYLLKASAYKRSFYGILARTALGLPVTTLRTNVNVTRGQVQALYQQPAVLRAVAYTQLGERERAESELRRVYMSLGRSERKAVVALAEKLDLPAAQISMARALGPREGELDYALYPMPAWAPPGGFTLDKSLIFAFARQESGFKPGAQGSGGAAGLMQLMPQTASIMRSQVKLARNLPLSDPSTNLALGESYLRHLMKLPAVDGNLFYLAAAYNAGPGKLIEWKKRGNTEDALLFMESIPYPLTRHYVQQVMANYWIYQDLAGNTAASAHALAAGSAPRYAAPERLSAQNERHDG